MVHQRLLLARFTKRSDIEHLATKARSPLSAALPFVISDSKNLKMEWKKNEVPGTGLSNKGWVDVDLFRDWLIGHFLEHAISVQPLLILQDPNI